MRIPHLLLAAALAAGCTEVRPASNFLLISVDTLRRDHLGAYGYERDTSPRLARLGEEGLVFEDAVSTSNWTLPAHVSLVTGLPPAVHGVTDDQGVLGRELTTLGEVLDAAGFATAGFTSHVYTDAVYGFGRGMHEFRTRPDQRAQRVTEAAITWLDAHPTERFFLFLHYFDPHWPFAPPEEYRERFGPADAVSGELATLSPHFHPSNPLPDALRRDAVTLYDAEIAYTDAEIGRLLDHLERAGRLDDTLVVLVSDHGEEFGEHGTFGHGTHLHAEVTRVPFLARYPPALAPARITEPVWLADVPRFALTVLGVAVPEQFLAFGADLLAPTGERELVLETTRWGPRRLAVVTGERALYTGGSYQPLTFEERDGETGPRLLPPVPLAPHVYDRSSDPGETTDLWPADAATEEWETLDVWLAAARDHALLTCPLDPERETVLTLSTSGGWPDEPYSAGALPIVVTSIDTRTTQVTLPPGTGACDLRLQLPSEASAVRLTLARGTDEAQLASFFVDDPSEVLGCTYVPPVERLPAAGGAELDEEQRAQLEKLGYVE